MKTAAARISPEDYILSVLPSEERLDAALKVAGEAFKKTKLKMKATDNAVRSVERIGVDG